MRVAGRTLRRRHVLHPHPHPTLRPHPQRITEWARRRWEHGLGGLGFPWEQGEAAWLLSGQLQSRAEEGRGADLHDGEDVPPEQLADPDSRWARCGGLRVHYKLALPQVRACSEERGGG